MSGGLPDSLADRLAGDAEDVFRNGGWVCAVCEQPTETVPCAEHQPVMASMEHLPITPSELECCTPCVQFSARRPDVTLEALTTVHAILHRAPWEKL